MDPTKPKNLEVLANPTLSNAEKLNRLVELNRSWLWQPNMDAEKQTALFADLMDRADRLSVAAEKHPGRPDTANHTAQRLEVAGGYLLRLFTYQPNSSVYSSSLLAGWYASEAGRNVKLLEEYYRQAWIVDPPKNLPAAHDMLLLLQQSVNAYEKADASRPVAGQPSVNGANSHEAQNLQSPASLLGRLGLRSFGRSS